MFTEYQSTVQSTSSTFISEDTKKILALDKEKKRKYQQEKIPPTIILQAPPRTPATRKLF